MLTIFEIGNKLPCVRRLGSRILSTKALEASRENEIPQKRFAKPQTDRQLKPLNHDFVPSLFSGLFDKNIFNYPSVLGNEEIDSLLKHSSEVESALNSVPQETEVTKDLLKSLNKVEVFGLTVPPKYGGLGYTETEAKFIQECTGIHPKMGRFLSWNEDLGIRVLNEFGTEEQKEKYLPKLTNGESFISFAFLENGPIVDLTTFQSSGMKDPERQCYILNAKKKWVHNANISDLMLVMVKSPSISEDENMILLNTFLVETNTPGVTVHKLKSPAAKEFEFYEVDLESVCVPYSNLIGTPNNGYEVLISTLSHSFLSSSVLVLSMLKKMIHHTALYCRENKLAEKDLMQFEHIQMNMSFLVTYVYMLESVIYFASGRFDVFEKPNLFMDAIIAKVLSVDILEKCIRKYIQTIGQDSFKESDILNEALKLLKYVMVFEENNDYLKLLLSSRSIIHAKSPAVEKTKKLWKPLDFPWESLVHNVSSVNGRIAKIRKTMKYNLKNELHASLQFKADELEDNLAKFQVVIEEFFYRFGADALSEEYAMIQFAEIASYLYASTACLARASDSICSDLPSKRNEFYLGQQACCEAFLKIESLCNRFLYYKDSASLHKEAGKMAFVNKEYPAEHPLIRTL